MLPTHPARGEYAPDLTGCVAEIADGVDILDALAYVREQPDTRHHLEVLEARHP